MTPDQQQRAIEKVCGWIIANPENDRADYRHWTPPNCVARPLHIFLSRPPNYLNDLNACHEMEQVLNATQRITYADQICILWTGRDDRAVPIWFWLTEAAAPQRAEAFLRTLGLWQPTPTQPR